MTTLSGKKGLVEWISRPQSYWLWPSFGFLIAGLTFDAAQRFRKAN